MTRYLAILCLLIFVAAIAPPPLPPIPKAKRKPAAIERGAGAKALMVKPKLVTVVPPRQWFLRWDAIPDAVHPDTNLVFLVRSSGSLRAPKATWPVVGTAQSNWWPFIIDRSVPAKYFCVQTSNVVDHAVSDL